MFSSLIRCVSCLRVPRECSLPKCILLSVQHAAQPSYFRFTSATVAFDLSRIQTTLLAVYNNSAATDAEGLQSCSNYFQLPG
jgi:hypothetical protein